MTPAAFADKWRRYQGKESAGSQEHFVDLCRLLEMPTPNEADPAGEWFCFERAVTKQGGGSGFADVWKQFHFGWEYKGPDGDLDKAYEQLLGYREALENPPLLVVSDLDRIQVHTNFTGAPKDVQTVTLADLAAGGDRTAGALATLRSVFIDPRALRPQRSPDDITEDAAAHFAKIARSMQERGHPAEAVARHLNRIVFCLFAEDAGLLPRRILTNLIESRRNHPAEFQPGLADLFDRMTRRDASRFYGNERVEWFNGGLFVGETDGGEVLDATKDELAAMHEAAVLDWSRVEPAILGTLFERGLDPAKRGQLGAHYTDTEKILMVGEPVVMQPLNREFAAMQAKVNDLMGDKQPTRLTQDFRRRVRLPEYEREAEETWRAFLERLRGVRVLDPACGSGNFLYIALRLLKDLEDQAIRWGAERLRITSEFPQVDPRNVLGLEINPYAKELAAVAIWIGHMQWMRDHGYSYPTNPVLQRLDNIEQRDAILVREEGKPPRPAEWPAAEFIVGNPPFLGDKKMRGALGADYVDSLREAWKERVPGGADLVCYWHEVARAQIAASKARRAGLLATNSIRRGANRKVLDRARQSGGIFVAWSDEEWVVEGADVRVSIVCQDAGTERERYCDGKRVSWINPDLTADTVDVTISKPLIENSRTAFVGIQKSGPFDIPAELAESMFDDPNVSLLPNSDVVVPCVNAQDLTGEASNTFLIDFGQATTEAEAARYEAPFDYAERIVKPVRQKNANKKLKENWWLLQSHSPAMRSALSPLARFICTPMTSKHRVFVWLSTEILPTNLVIAIARDDDYAFGVLQSRPHHLWSLRLGNRMGVGNDPRYNPSQTFATFPFPWPLNVPAEKLTPPPQITAMP